MKRRDFLKYASGSVALAISPINRSLASPFPAEIRRLPTPLTSYHFLETAEQSRPTVATTRKISIVGVGGAGIDIVTTMLTKFSKPKLSSGVELAYYGVDTGNHALHRAKQRLDLEDNALTRIWVSAQHPFWDSPEQVRKAAWRNRTQIAGELKLATTSKLIVIANLAGRSGAGFSQFISYQARTMGVPVTVCLILPCSIATRWFNVEHELARLYRSADRVVTFTFDESDEDALFLDVVISCQRDVITFATELIERG